MFLLHIITKILLIVGNKYVRNGNFLNLNLAQLSVIVKTLIINKRNLLQSNLIIAFNSKQNY